MKKREDRGQRRDEREIMERNFFHLISFIRFLIHSLSVCLLTNHSPEDTDKIG